jgi:hypothetical protein
MSYNSIRRDRRRMTCLIHARNKYKTLVASDSWNTSSIHNHMIQKITINKKFPCILSSAGENSATYDNGDIVNILDFMNAFVQRYNGYNFQECLHELLEKSYKFINDMRLNNDYEKVVQYFIVYYDVTNQTIISKAFEIVKNTSGTYSYELTERINLNFTSFGTYWYEINTKFFKTVKILFIKEKVFKIIKKYSKLESKLPIDERKVGGPIQWAQINRQGKLIHSNNIVSCKNI